LKESNPEISDAEWDVMNVIWQAPGPLTAADVVARLEETGPAGSAGGRSPRTVKTFLNRLLNKGVLAAEAEGNRYLYRAKLSREQCVKAETRSFLSRVFAGATGPMLVQFVRQAKLSADEVTELKRLLDEKGDQR
jgi:BlaI family penicillinase repressor